MIPINEVSLSDMFVLSSAVSAAPKPAPPPKKYTYDPKLKSDLEKREELVTAMIDRMTERDKEPLPQDAQEGVGDDEWVSLPQQMCGLLSYLSFAG